jgi:hypothetical protein
VPLGWYVAVATRALADEALDKDNRLRLLLKKPRKTHIIKRERAVHKKPKKKRWHLEDMVAASSVLG